MDTDEFIQLVKCMRARQKEFFRTREQSLIAVCRDWERRVDDAIKKLTTTPPIPFTDEQEGE